jgi:hypothetical protein
MKERSDYFEERPSLNPTIYAYEDTNPQYEGLLKVGFTTKGTAGERVAQQYPTKRPGPAPYKIVFEGAAMRGDGTAFSDHDVHRQLLKNGILNPEGEWFRCTVEQVKAAFISVRDRSDNEENRTQAFGMRPEQEEAVSRTYKYFREFRKTKANPQPHFLWNAKMRFGKTFASYQLAKRMGWKRILVLTFKPAVQNAWESDLKSHVDFKGWQFVSPGGLRYEDADTRRPIVCFGSFQDYLGRNKESGGIKTKNEWVHDTKWDCVILDEYHFGAWNDRSKSLFEKSTPGAKPTEETGELEDESEGLTYFQEEIMPIKTGAYLYLSGTPFRALATGEFIEEQIYNWTYADEQRAKAKWRGKNNPYEALPRMVLLTYQLPDSVRHIAMQGEFNEFDLNLFFSASGRGDEAKFTYEDEVSKWLQLIRGAYLETSVDHLKQGHRKPPLPFADGRLLSILTHTVWFLPDVSACHAMRNLLSRRNNQFYHDYKVIVAAGTETGTGAAALPPVREAMEDPLRTKTITLTCGKLTTGVTVAPWTGIFMLRNLSSPETYFQAAFRVQSPWTLPNPDGKSPNAQEILKSECYVFDFAPDRALRQIAEYSQNLNTGTDSPQKKVAEFISFLPVLAYDGSSMKEIDAAGILDMATTGTTATLLARRWESALLVNVDNRTLQRLLDSKEAMAAISKIEGFRALRQDITAIINKSEVINKLKRESNERKLTAAEKQILTEEEKSLRKSRREIQEKLIKFATRIPVFMYLTDYREETLRDVITKLDTALFHKTTGLELKDFETLVSLGVFNENLMNASVLAFRSYENPSLLYTGINRRKGEGLGAWATKYSAKEAAILHQPILTAAKDRSSK